MLTDTLITLFTRDLEKLRKEIEFYRNEETLWKTETGIANSAGNLCLHLIGNLNTYIGKELGGTGYTRNREQEFSLKNVPRSELIAKIDETLQVVKKSLGNLDPRDLDKEYPVLVFEHKTSTEYFLVHLVAHLSYHLGQINYHRRLIDK